MGIKKPKKNKKEQKRTKKEQKEPLFVLRRVHNKKIERYYSTRE